MLKRTLSAVLLVAVLAVTGLALSGCCNKEPDKYGEDHQDVNTTKVKDRTLRAE